MFFNETHSDVLVKCHGRSFRLHRVILASRSDFFRACIERGFKVRYRRSPFSDSSDRKQETQDSVIEVHDDPDVLETFLLFLYTLSDEFLDHMAQRSGDDRAKKLEVAKHLVSQCFLIR